MVFNLLLGKLTQQLPLYLLGKSLLIAALQLSVGIVEARDSVLPHYRGYVVCKRVSKKAQPLSAFQVGSWRIKTFLLQFSCNTALETILFFSVENTEVLLLILIQNKLFSKLLKLFLEVPFSRIQVPNYRPWDLSKTTQISIFSLCPFTTLRMFEFMPIIFS